MKLSIFSEIFTPYSFANSQRLLIKPFERLRFVIFFTAATVLSSIAAPFIYDRPAFYLFRETSQIQHGIVIGIITGVLLGASQWLVIREYISDWKWILVSCLFVTTSQTIRNFIDIFVKSEIASGFVFSKETLSMIPVLVITFITVIGTFLMFGYLQWCVIRRYVINARWWILMPSIVGAILLLTTFLPVGYSTHNLSWLKDITSITVLPATQAICFCLLKRKIVSEQPIEQSSLALAPDLVNYWEIKKLEKKLRARIRKIWITDLETSKKLSYLVGINRTGEIVAYEPLDRDAADYVNQTPLPQLAENANNLDLHAENLTSFAKFTVMFTPPSIVESYSLRGFPLIWLAIAIYSVIILN